MSVGSTLAALVGAALLAVGSTGCGDASNRGGVATVPEAVSVSTSPETIGEATTTTQSVTTAAPATTAPATTVPVTTPPSTTVPSLFDVMTPEGWSVVNDTVMGGVSSGDLSMDDGMLVFTGELSLENNGGFASVRSPLIDPQTAADWASRVGPRIVAEGDGRTWTVEVRTDDVEGGWIAVMTTSAGSVTDVALPWTSFEPVTRFLDPRQAAAPLDPGRVRSIAFYLVDGVEGPFRLGIRSIS